MRLGWKVVFSIHLNGFDVMGHLALRLKRWSPLSVGGEIHMHTFHMWEAHAWVFRHLSFIGL